MSDTIRWEQDDDGIVVLTLDDPNQSANTMNAAYKASMARDGRPARGREGLDHGRRHHLRQEDVLRRRRPQRPQARRRKEDAAEVAGMVARAQGATCAAWRRSASRSSPRSTAPRSAAAWRSRWPCHHRVIVDDPKAVARLPRGAARPAPGRRRRRCARCACSASPTRCMQLLLQGQRLPSGAGAKELGLVDEVVAVARGARPGREGVDRGEPRGRSSRGTSRATRSRAARRRTRSSRRTCRRSRRTCASSSRARTTRRRTTSWPRRSRARRSTSTPRSRSRAATSSTSPPARSPRT